MKATFRFMREINIAFFTRPDSSHAKNFPFPVNSNYADTSVTWSYEKGEVITLEVTEELKKYIRDGTIQPIMLDDLVREAIALRERWGNGSDQLLLGRLFKAIDNYVTLELV